jgi:hypothetical protein
MISYAFEVSDRPALCGGGGWMCGLQGVTLFRCDRLQHAITDLAGVTSEV